MVNRKRSLDALGRAGQGRVAPVPGGLRAVHQAVLRVFAATGSAPGPEEVSVPDVDVAAVLTQLHDQDFIRLGADGRVAVAYPFSATPTPHVVRLPGGVTAYAMCAIDGLGIASMLGAPVEIRSSDPVTGAAIAVRVPASGDDAEWDPDSTVVLAGTSASGCDDLRPAVDVCCGTVNFFASGESAVSWMAEHPGVDGAVLDRDRALRLGTKIFGPLLTVQG